MNVIFLDMDGVVNSEALVEQWIKNKFTELENNGNCYLGDELRLAVRKAFIEEFCNSEELVFPELAAKITRIVKETGAKIVWSSTWRLLERYQSIEAAKEMFNRRGLPGDALIGYTPQIGRSYENNCRGTEINYWINNNIYGNIEKVAVIDDRYDAGWNLPDCAYFFQTNVYIGITDKITQKVIDYLKGNENVELD